MLSLNGTTRCILCRSKFVISDCAFAVNAALRALLKTQLTTAAKLAASFQIRRVLLLAHAMLFIRVVTAMIDSVALEVIGNAFAVCTFHCIRSAIPAQASRVVFVTLVWTIDDSVAQPVIQDAFLVAAFAFEVVLVAAAILFIRVISAVGIAITDEALVDAILLILTMEQRIIRADHVAAQLIAVIVAIVFSVASKKGIESEMEGNFESVTHFKDPLMHLPSLHLNSDSEQFLSSHPISSE